MTTLYDARNWFWFVGDDLSRLWSSALGAYVPVDDADYQAWTSAENTATRIDCEQSLSDVLAVYGLRGPYVDLVSYAAETRWRTETGGVSINGMAVATDRESQAMLTGASAFVAANPAAVVRWKSDDGFVTLDAATVTALALAVGAHVQNCFAIEADVSEAITEGTLTTTAEVDAAFFPVESSEE